MLILDDSWKRIFNAANTKIDLQGEEHTVTLLGLAINNKDKRNIEDMIRFLTANGKKTDVINAKNIKIKHSDGKESTLRAFEYAATLGDEYVKSILNAAMHSGRCTLKYVFDALKEAGNQDTLSKYSTNISNVAVNLELYQLESIDRTLKKEAENQALNDTFDQVIKTIEQRKTKEKIKEKEKTIGKAIETDTTNDKANLIGSVCSVITALAVGIGCGVWSQGVMVWT
ncbi:MAG: hypothetical protein ACR5K9_07565 [Wolbachia sp.]